MRVAVSGASGFIGRHVLEALRREAGVEVIAASRHADASNDQIDSSSRQSEAPLHRVALDIGSPSSSDFERLGRPDVLIHLAWSGLPNYQSLHHFESELQRQYAFLESLVRSGLRSVLVAGTCYEYGMTHGELAESLEVAATNPYAHAKTALRHQLQFLRVKHPFALTWTRLFYTYGNGQATTSLYSQLLAATQRGDASFAMSKGEQLRDFLPVEKVASHLVELALRCPDAGVVNVCSGEPVSVRAFVEHLVARNGWRIALDLGQYPYPEYEPLAFWGSTQKLKRLLAAAGASRHAA